MPRKVRTEREAWLRVWRVFSDVARGKRNPRRAHGLCFQIQVATKDTMLQHRMESRLFGWGVPRGLTYGTFFWARNVEGARKRRDVAKMFAAEVAKQARLVAKRSADPSAGTRRGNG